MNEDISKVFLNNILKQILGKLEFVFLLLLF